MRATSIGHAGILIETAQATIACDPWFTPAFFGSWFVFPRNDQLPERVQQVLAKPDYLYISHLHGDHLDEDWLPRHVDLSTPVLLPGYPTKEMERRIRQLGFTEIIRTVDGEELDLGGGLTIAIHVETSITDGPAGDSALVVSDGETRLVNQNDCRTSDLSALAAHGPIDLHWLQFSGAIWYPMVYDESPETMRELLDIKVESQFARALRYVEAIGARYVVPSAGPPCFLDDDLYFANMITGDEVSIFPDQREFISRLAAGAHVGILNVPGTEIDITPTSMTVTHPMPDAEVRSIFTDKDAYLRRYQADWADWLTEHKATWHAPTPDLLQTIIDWWQPILAMAPTVCDAVGAGLLLRAVDSAGTGAGDVEVYVDFPTATVRAWDGVEPFRYSFEIQRELVETVVANRAVDWSDKLFLSVRFRAHRDGPFNEYVYNFFKSLSPERMRRTEAEALRKLSPPTESEEIEIGDHVVERWCPHRQADLSVFGEIDGDHLVCTLHGWTFDLETGQCLNAQNRKLQVRRRT
jgi:UDP-MurNAc hydroxylase